MRTRRPEEPQEFEAKEENKRHSQSNVCQAAAVESKLENITERKGMEEALQASEEKFRKLAETAGEGILCADSAGKIIYVNGAALRIFQYTAEEVLGQPLTTLMPERFREPHRRGLDRYLTTGEAHVIGKTVELAGLRKDGSEFPLELSIATWKSSEGMFFAGIVSDIAERKRAEETLRELSGRLLQVQDEDRRAWSRELHDSTSPSFTSLISKLYQMKRRAQGQDAASSELASDSIALAESLAREIKAFSHVLHPPLLDEQGFIAALRWYIDSYGRQSRVRVETDLPEKSPRLSRDAEIALFRIVQDCLTNILRHVGNRMVKVRLALDQERLRVEVGDRGRRIAPEDLELIVKGKGELGVGFASMRERLRQLGGSLQVNSDDSGTLITAILPLGEAPGVLPRAEESS